MYVYNTDVYKISNKDIDLVLKKFVHGVLGSTNLTKFTKKIIMLLYICTIIIMIRYC